jgi:nucleoside 2-deoxyribosyltransferase
VANEQSDYKTVRCFVIMPFGIKRIPGTDYEHDYDEVFNALNKLQNIDPKFPIEVFRADVEEVERENLATHVHSCIDSADFCIADITGKNPNVMYEIGFARGKGLKVIVICDENEDIPTDLKGIVYVTYKKENLSGLASRVKQHFRRVTFDMRKKDIVLPMVQYLARRNDGLIRNKIRESRLRIEILQTNLSILQRDFIDDIIVALETHENLKVRILTLDPQSVFVNYRANQLEDTEVRIFRAELLNALETTYVKLRKYGNRVNIKIYDDFPSQIAFFFDGETLASVVSAMGRSRDNCAFLVPPDMPNAQESFGHHFSHLWSNKSRTYREYGTD